MGFAQRYDATLDELARVCAECGRDPGDVAVMAVSKTVGPAEVAEAIEGGCALFGENRPEQLSEKATLFPQVSWHFIGNVQSRKIGQIVGSADLVHSVYRSHHLPKIDAAARGAGKVQDILLEVNVSGESSKSGVAPQDLPVLVQAVLACPNVRLRGLMTMAPQGDERAARECFAGLAQLKAQVAPLLPESSRATFTELSMGMSEDWPQAVAEGATIVRIGRALFSGEFSR